MKKIYVAMMIVILTATASYGAVSDDVYVRRDVFDAKMESMFNRLHGDIQVLSGKIDALDKRIEGIDKRIDGVNTSLSARIDDLRNGLYLWLVAIGLFVSWPKAKETVQKWGKATPSITLEDVQRLIEQNNARMAGKAQV